MRVHLERKWRDRLSDLPETGMGSQNVDIYLKGGHVIRDVHVFNGEDCETEKPFDAKDVQDIRLHSK